ncbi:unnamed protein product [Alopecurus aequalis]
MIHNVLGTPIGGLKIGENVDDGLRQSIAKLTKCKDSFVSYDISTAVLDKLANCIELYNKGLSCVLGGNLLSLLIIYLDFHNMDSVPFHLRTKLPRISVWTSEMVTEVESMDCISWESRTYGKLPMKSISDTPFAPSAVQHFVKSNRSYDDLLKFVLSITPNHHQQTVLDKLTKMMANMEKEIVQSIEPIVCDNIINVLNLATSVNSKSKKSDACGLKIVEAQAKSAVSGFHTISKAAELRVPMSELGKEYNRFTDPNMCFAVRKHLTSGAQRSGYVTFPGINLVVPTSDLSKHLNCSENDIQDDFPRFFLIPEPEDSVVSKLDEEACNFPDMKNSMCPKKIGMSTENAVVSPAINLVSFLREESACEAKVWKSMTAKRPNVDEKTEISNDLFISSFHQNSQKMNKRLSWMSTNVVDVQCIALKKRPRMFQCMSNNQPVPLDEGPDAVQHHETVQSPFHITAEETSGKNDVSRSKLNGYGRSDLHTTPLITEKAIGSSIDFRQSAGNIIGSLIHARQSAPDCSFQGTPDNSVKLGTNDYPWSDKVWVNELLDSTDKIEKDYYAKQINSQLASQRVTNIHISEINPTEYCSSYSSTVVEKDVFNDIVNRIPKTTKSKTLQVVRMGTSWVEHRVFGLSMQVYGKVHSYVVDMLGKSVMVEDVEKNKLDLLKEGQWKRFYIECKVVALCQLEYENPGKLAVYLSNRMLGFMLDSMDLVHLPLHNSGFYFLLNEAKVAVKNFKMAFNLAYKNSLINIDAMNTVFKSVCSSDRDGDSGVFVMKMICGCNASRTFCFEPEHAKPIREMLTYYMVAHPFNEVMPTETRKILDRHGIAHDYKTPGYFPWMHEQSEASSQDSLEKIAKF